MYDLDEWRMRGVRWHAYAEIRYPSSIAERSDRTGRLARTPDALLHTPDDVVDWIATLTRRHATDSVCD